LENNISGALHLTLVQSSLIRPRLRVTAALSRAERKTRVCVSLSKAKRVKSQQAAARRRRSSRGQHAPRQGQQHDKKIVTLFEFQTRCAGSSPNLNSPKRIGLFFKTD